MTDQDFIEFLNINVSYDEQSGLFAWKQKRQGAIAGKFGSIEKTGYVRVKLLNKKYLAHRLAWFIVHKQWPDGQIDHINGNRSDNRIVNLRVVDQSGNSQNRRAKQKNNQSGYFGVHASGAKWRAQIRIDKKLKHLGLFDTPELASMAYIEAKRSIHATCTI
jgi:hypothetical protein